MNFLKNKTLIATLAVGMFSVAAQAEKITCVFTEPFFTSEYDSSTSELKYRDSISGAEKSLKGVQLKALNQDSIALVSAEGKTLQTLFLSMNGSDGMSEVVYPYDVKDIGQQMIGISIYGGCYSEKLKTTRK